MGSKGGRVNTQEQGLDPANVSPDELATNQEATPVPYIAGEMKLAVRWISPAYDQYTQDVPSGGKK
ncbi:MAG TPA: hypothetical protein VLT16_00615 [Candidatus Limnocylindrales bacterium]|nr:hypothetical protein [Candidatus Limnocylindrales bacterium]